MSGKLEMLKVVELISVGRVMTEENQRKVYFEQMFDTRCKCHFVVLQYFLLLLFLHFVKSHIAIIFLQSHKHFRCF